MEIIVIGALILIPSFAGWHLAKYLERAQYLPKMAELQTNALESQKKVRNLQVELREAESQFVKLEGVLTNERKEKAFEISRVAKGFKQKFALYLPLLFLGGLALGVGGTETRHALSIPTQNPSEKAQISLSSELSILKLELLEKKFTEIELETKSLRKEILEAKVQEAIAKTKLQILMSSLTERKFRSGFVLDNDKLRKNLFKNYGDQILQNKQQLENPNPVRVIH